MEHGKSAFWDDLARDLQDPEFLRHYIAESSRIAAFDNIVNGLRDALSATGLSQNALAQAVPANPAAVRRLLSRGHLNPTLNTITAIAAGLGYRLTLEPIPDPDRTLVSEALRTGKTSDPHALIAALEAAKASGNSTAPKKKAPGTRKKAAAASGRVTARKVHPKVAQPKRGSEVTASATRERQPSDR